MRLVPTIAVAACAWLAVTTRALAAMTVYYAVQHAPGPAWKADVPFFEQPGLQQHVGYMRTLYDRGLIPMGGPFMDGSGGMMILRVGSLEEATKLANEDPAVKAGVLRVVVRPWGNPWPIQPVGPSPVPSGGGR